MTPLVTPLVTTPTPTPMPNPTPAPLLRLASKAPVAASAPGVDRETGRGSAFGSGCTTGSGTHDTAEELGWDCARHGYTPPLERLCINPLLQRGFRAGRAVYGLPRERPAPAVLRWLQLRLDALARGLAFETVQLTPRYLTRLPGTHCPITRETLPPQHTSHGAPLEADGPTIARARLDAAYAAGNLLLMSRRAQQARERIAGSGYREGLAQARAGAGETGPDGATAEAGLDAEAWRRAALLASYVQALPHAEAGGLPMLVLPAVGLRLLNPVQALQALVCRALQHPTPNRRLVALREALPGVAARAAYDAVVELLTTGVAAEQRCRPGGPLAWAIEDAWRSPLLLARWRAFTRALDADACAAVVRACAAGSALLLPDALATEGWALATQGRIRARPAGLQIVRAPRSQPGPARVDLPSAGRPAAKNRIAGWPLARPLV